MKSYRAKRVGTIAAICVSLAAVLLTWHSLQSPVKSVGMQEYFTDDDGVTWFPGDGTRIPPFDHNGKPAVLAKVYQCASGRQFVGYLVKFSDQTRERMESARSAHGLMSTTAMSPSAILVKKPHDKDWISQDDPKAAAVEKVVCPDGGTDVERVVP